MPCQPTRESYLTFSPRVRPPPPRKWPSPRGLSTVVLRTRIFAEATTSQGRLAASRSHRPWSMSSGYVLAPHLVGSPRRCLIRPRSRCTALLPQATIGWPSIDIGILNNAYVPVLRQQPWEFPSGCGPDAQNLFGEMLGQNEVCFYFSL